MKLLPTIHLKKGDHESTDSATQYVNEGESKVNDKLTVNESISVSMSFDSREDTDSPTTKGKLLPFEDSNTS